MIWDAYRSKRVPTLGLDLWLKKEEEEEEVPGWHSG